MKETCEASGPGWDCGNVAETQVYGRLCVSHHNQMRRSGTLRAIRRRPTRDEVFAGWAALLRDAGWKVVAPR